MKYASELSFGQIYSNKHISLLCPVKVIKISLFLISQSLIVFDATSNLFSGTSFNAVILSFPQFHLLEPV